MAKDKFLQGVGGELRPITSADNVAPFTNASGAVSVGQAVYLSGAGAVAPASATTTGQPAIGFVYEVTDLTHCVVIFGGVFESFTTGMTPGDSYYLAEAAGTVQTTPVLGATKLAQYLGKAISATDLRVEPEQMALVGTSAGNLIALDYAGKLPAVDGSQLTNLPAAGGGLVAANNLSDLANATTARSNLGLGSAAVLTAGTAANNAVQLDGSAKLPAVDGSQLINLSGTMGNGRTFYYNYTDASDIGGAYKIAQNAPSTNAESSLTLTNSGTGWNLAATFATPVGVPGVTLLPAGISDRSFWGMVDHGAARLQLETYVRTHPGGTETLLRTSTSPSFSHTTAASIDWSTVDASSHVLGLTDRLVYKLYTARVSGPANVDVSLYFEGTDRVSHTHSTIGEPTPALTAISLVGPPTAADQYLYSTAASTWTLGTITQSGRALAGISWSAGTQVPSLTAAGTAAMLTVGTGANNLVQLNGSSQLPALDGSLLTGVGGSGVAVKKTFSQASNGFAVGDVLRNNGTDWVKAQANSAANAEVFGIVDTTGDPVFSVTFSGYISGLSGLTAGAGHFLSPSSAGAVTATDPTTSGQVSKPVLVAITTTTAVVQIQRGYVIP